MCKPAPTGNSWCQYLDTTCPGGIRWSSEAGDNLASACVAPHAITVTKQGSGSGIIASTPPRINCGPTCMGMFADGSSITLSAMPDSASFFGGWGGDGASCGTSTVCTLAVTRALNVSAAFPPVPRHDLIVTKVGTGVGSVTSEGLAIDCGSICQTSFQSGTVVTLTANPGTKSIFEGWGGGAQMCGTNATCSITMDNTKAVTAAFALIPDYSIGITRAGDGSGRVTSMPGTIDCGSVCLGAFQRGTSVKLTAIVDDGSTWGGWSGDVAACGQNLTCTLTVDTAKTVTAVFMKMPTHALAVTVSGNGTGMITSQPPGIDCGASCGASFRENTPVTLSAAANDGSTFVGWGGDAVSCARLPSCALAMDKAKNVTAIFATTGSALWLGHLGSEEVNSGDGYDIITSVRTASATGFIVVGSLGNTTATLNGTAIPTTFGAQDIFLARIRAVDGGLDWALTLGSPGTEVPMGLTVDKNGDAVVAGTIGSDAIHLGALQPFTAAPRDFFVAKYRGTNGTFVWAHRIRLGSDAVAAIRGVAARSDGSIVVTGFVKGSIDFGDGLVSTTTPAVFVLKLRGSDGTLERKLVREPEGTSATATGNAVAVDASDNIIVVGQFSVRIQLGEPRDNCYGFNSNGADDIFIVKLRGDDLRCLWTNRYGTTGNDSATAVTTDGSSNVLFAGTLSPAPVRLGGDDMLVPTRPEENDVFVAKFSPSDVRLWARRLPARTLNGITTMSADDVLVGGGFEGSFAFDAQTLSSSQNSTDAYALVLTANTGMVRWGLRMGGSNYDLTRDVAAGPQGHVLVGGSFNAVAEFSNATATSRGGADGFLVEFLP